MKVTLIKDWGDLKKGQNVNIEDKAVLDALALNGIIDVKASKEAKK
jgi:hypothetical protein